MKTDAPRIAAALAVIVWTTISAACASASTAPSPTAGNTTLTFGGLTERLAPVGLYTESGFSVSANPGGWFSVTTYGNPAPSLQFAAPSGATVTGQVTISAAGHGPFRFVSVDLYSSVTPIPYTITGLRDDRVVFALADRLPNTFGNFWTVVNPRSTDAIDTLVIALSDSSSACCGPNPMGIDNIALTR